ncbi:MAG TPA: hypothetical protein VN634_15585 [Candidatus Limnocylindrales bacterium]|nr:hypothetical protein [Candidatus Limnocylindrales bacterium]
MLSKFDDYPIHQTPEPVAHPASSDRNVYDRYWFNGYANDGEFYFGVGMGLYPHRGILDCGFSIARDGEQHSFHASRRAPSEPSETVVGPFSIEVVEPMKRTRVRLESNSTGIEVDLEFTARTACVEEGRQTRHYGQRIFMDATRFAQYGRWQGTIRYDGKTLAIDRERVFGTKDRSWGIRPVGAPEMDGAPRMEMPQFFFLWAPIQWKTRCTHFATFEDSDGRPWHQDGAIVPVYERPDDIPGVNDPAIRYMARVEHKLEYFPGMRRARRANIALVERGGARHEIALESLLTFQMKGIGYQHQEWGHGHWKGELAMAGESWKQADLDPLAFDNLHTQQVVRATMNGEEGVGVLEQIAIGPHETSGLTGFLDGAE